MKMRAFVSAASLKVRAEKSPLFLRAFPCVSYLVIVHAFSAAKIGKKRLPALAQSLFVKVFQRLQVAELRRVHCRIALRLNLAP